MATFAFSHNRDQESLVKISGADGVLDGPLRIVDAGGLEASLATGDDDPEGTGRVVLVKGDINGDPELASTGTVQVAADRQPGEGEELITLDLIVTTLPVGATQLDASVVTSRPRS